MLFAFYCSNLLQAAEQCSQSIKTSILYIAKKMELTVMWERSTTRTWVFFISLYHLLAPLCFVLDYTLWSRMPSVHEFAKLTQRSLCLCHVCFNAKTGTSVLIDILHLHFDLVLLLVIENTEQMCTSYNNY